MGDVEQVDPEGWVDRHGDSLYRYAFLRLRAPDLAADVVQETFLEALAPVNHSPHGRRSERGSSGSCGTRSLTRFENPRERRQNQTAPRQMEPTIGRSTAVATGGTDLQRGRQAPAGRLKPKSSGRSSAPACLNFHAGSLMLSFCESSMDKAPMTFKIPWASLPRIFGSAFIGQGFC